MKYLCCDNPTVEARVSHRLFKYLIGEWSVSAPTSLSPAVKWWILPGGGGTSRNFTDGSLLRNTAGCVLCCLFVIVFVVLPLLIYIHQLQPSGQQLHFHFSGFSLQNKYSQVSLFHSDKTRQSNH